MTHNENTKTNDKATVWLMLLFGAGLVLLLTGSILALAGTDEDVYQWFNLAGLVLVIAGFFSMVLSAYYSRNSFKIQDEVKSRALKNPEAWGKFIDATDE